MKSVYQNHSSGLHTIGCAESPMTDDQREIPLVVLNNICLHLRFDHAQGTLLSILLASKDSYEIAAPHLYRDLYITGNSLVSIMRGIRLPVTQPAVPITQEGAQEELRNISHPKTAGRYLENYDDAARALLRSRRREKLLRMHQASQVGFAVLQVVSRLTTGQVTYHIAGTDRAARVPQ
jgi:hypothetical protein